MTWTQIILAFCILIGTCIIIIGGLGCAIHYGFDTSWVKSLCYAFCIVIVGNIIRGKS